MSELTPRQWKLYEFLKKQSGWVTQYIIAINLEVEYPCTISELQDFHNSRARQLITEDIRAINKSDVIQKLILSTSSGIKLATEEEAKKYIKSKYAAIFRQLNLARKLERKAGLDGQMRIVLGSEREIVQAFTDSNAEGERWRMARKLAAYTQKQAVALFKKYIPTFDEPLLSKIENGVVIPTVEQQAAFAKVYI